MKELPNAIICDLDGTLCKRVTDRSPYEWHRVGEDKVHQHIADLLELYMEHDTKIILVSGRDESCREETVSWLYDNEIAYNFLFMRPEGNNEKDTIIKERIYNERIRGKYNVEFVLDDRDCVVQKWRELGLVCFQVAPGNF